jgi:hypothetical protein
MRLHYLLASTLLVTAAACASDQPEGELPIEDGDVADLGKADHSDLDLVELDANIGSTRLQKGGTFIITSKTAWKNVMGTKAPADVDFSKEWVAFFGTGVKNTGGYSAAVKAIAYYPSHGALVLDTHATSPGHDCIVTQAFTNPHMAVKFSIPKPRPTFALASSTSEVKKCGPSNADRLEELADSKAKWDAAKASNNDSYTYTRDFQSWSGFGFQTTVVVENGVVTERHYKAQHISGGDSTQWSETGAQVGTHDEGFPAVTVDALYTECKDTVLVQDENKNWMNFGVDERGFLQVCTYTPMACQDDCTRGPVLSTLTF